MYPSSQRTEFCGPVSCILSFLALSSHICICSSHSLYTFTHPASAFSDPLLQSLSYLLTGILILLCWVSVVQPVKAHLPSLTPQQYCLSPPSHPATALSHSCWAPTTLSEIKLQWISSCHHTALNQASDLLTVPPASSTACTLGTKGAPLRQALPFSALLMHVPKDFRFKNLRH